MRSNYPEEIWGNSTPDALKITTFHPTSIILTTTGDSLINGESLYAVRFDTGMVRVPGISISENGEEIKFSQEGSYRFELQGGIVPFSQVQVTLVFFNQGFTDEMKVFNERSLSYENREIRLQESTILPLKENQTIVVKLVPVPDESIIIKSGIQLIINRVD